MVTYKRSAAVVKKLTSKAKKQTEIASGIINPVHFVVATENTSNPRSQLFHK